MTDARLYAAQVAALEADCECAVFAFRDDGQFNQQSAMLSRPDSRADLERLRVLTLLACGREDRVTPVVDHEAMATRVPGARLEIIEHCGHLSTLEQPEIVNRVLKAWLKETEANSVVG